MLKILKFRSYSLEWIVVKPGPTKHIRDPNVQHKMKIKPKDIYQA